MARALQQVLLCLLMVACGCCQAVPSRHTPTSQPYQQRTSVMHMVMQQLQLDDRQQWTAADECSTVREKKKCLHHSDACVWCQNKYSPWPGSDGVCTTPDQAKYLPDSTYKCSKHAAAQHAAATTGARPAWSRSRR